MPSNKRKLPEEFEETTVRKVRCKPCSSQIGARDIRRKGIEAHTQTDKHKASVQLWRHAQEQSERDTHMDHEAAMSSACTLASESSTSLFLAEQFNSQPRRQDTEMHQSKFTLNPVFADIMSSLAVLDDEDVVFTAGKSLNNDYSHLHRQFKNLDLYEHTIFANEVREPIDYAHRYLSEDDDNTVPDIVKRLQQQNQDDEEADDLDPTEKDAQNGRCRNTGADAKLWEPYHSKTMFMIDLLDSLPRLRLSDDHLKTILWVMKECGTPDVPSFTALRKVQKQLTDELDLQPIRHTSALGNEFYANCPARMLRLDWANPLVRPYIRPLVEVSSEISEFNQAQRLQNEDFDLLQLMWADWKGAPHRYFYIKELARLHDGRFVVPMKWICVLNKDGSETECTDVYLVQENADDTLSILTDQLVRIEASQLAENYPELKLEREQMGLPFYRFSGKGFATMGASDASSYDVSGNRTKQYNPHTNVYLANMDIPHSKRQQEYFVRFYSTSTDASALEQLEALQKATGPTQWIDAYDCELETDVLFRVISRLEPADNPQQSEHCSHVGLNGNLFCRRCKVGGPSAYVESNEGYHELFQRGAPRTVKETLAEIEAQLDLAALGVKDHVEKRQTLTGVKDSVAQRWIEELLRRSRELRHQYVTNPATQDKRLKKAKGDARTAVKNDIAKRIQRELREWLVKQPPHRYELLPEDSELRHRLRPGDHYNHLLSCPGLDVHRDTPVETLHTMLLGHNKYVWHRTHTTWTTDQLELLSVRLECSSVDGLSIDPVRGTYLVQYKNSLVGRHFRILQQVTAFHLYGELHDEKLLGLWRALGELGALLSYDSIKNLENYLSDLQVCIDNMLDCWAVIDPNRIIEKPKLHLLPHIIEDIRNHGPSKLYSTEIFECWNAVFRMASVLSNHHAPSHDIAVAIAEIERFKHIVSGGWWKDGSGNYIQAGEKIRTFLRVNGELQRRLGWTEGSQEYIKPGYVKLEPEKRDAKGGRIKRAPISWSKVMEDSDLPRTTPSPSIEPGASEITWTYGRHVISESKDVCREGSWVFFCEIDPVQSLRAVHPGRVRKILVPWSASVNSGSLPNAVILIDVYAVGARRDGRTGMPVLTARMEGNVHRKCSTIAPENILFIFNAQHDCAVAECGLVDIPLVQERHNTRRTRRVIKHEPQQRFLVNTHSTHNAALLRETLPPELTKPEPLFEDRAAKHHEIATELQLTGPAKRAEARQRAAETRKRNKQDKGLGTKGSEQRSRSSPEKDAGALSTLISSGAVGSVRQQASKPNRDLCHNWRCSFATLVARNDATSIPAELDFDRILGKLEQIAISARTLRNARCPAMRLPSEVLGTIFELVQDDLYRSCIWNHPEVVNRRADSVPDWDEPSLHPYQEWRTILVVCRHWYNVALSRASLWATVLVDGHPDSQLSRTSIHFVQHLLQKSRQHALDVLLYTIQDDEESFVSELISHFPRIKTLYLGDCTITPSVKRLLTEGTASSLQTLTLDICRRRWHGRNSDSEVLYSQLFAGSANVLRSLHLSGAQFDDNFAVSFGNLRHLRLTALKFSTTHFLSLLALLKSNATTLEDLAFSDCTFMPVDGLEQRRLQMHNLGRIDLPDTGAEILVAHLGLISPFALSCPGPIPANTLSNALTSESEMFTAVRLSLGQSNYIHVCAIGQSSALRTSCFGSGTEFSAIRRMASDVLRTVRDWWVEDSRLEFYARDFAHETTLHDEALHAAGTAVRLYLCGYGSLRMQPPWFGCNKLWLAALKGDLAVAENANELPCPLLRELHILHPSVSDIEDTKDALESRIQQGLAPLDKLYVYLPSGGPFGHGLPSGQEAVEKWEAIAPALLQPLVGEFSLVRTSGLPCMELPPVLCRPHPNAYASYWQWPLWTWDHLTGHRSTTSIWSD
ncbi:hypothetical protein NM688_g352 [Phlebia brevispora]|uniref:Uncharacterized protein n=1 Tax=Phlebia brevispora TaxID=194682 RepID=A0ACC1TEY9_9APHY|nr:hypothetical protein NM688_g352 [Phlebia brevispora]